MEGESGPLVVDGGTGTTESQVHPCPTTLLHGPRTPIQETDVALGTLPDPPWSQVSGYLPGGVAVTVGISRTVVF